MQNAEFRKTLRVLDYTGFARGGAYKFKSVGLP